LMLELFTPELCGCDSPNEDEELCMLWALDAYCLEFGRSLAEFGMRTPMPRMLINYPDDLYDLHCHNRDVAFGQFSDEQHAAATCILNAVTAGSGGIFYIQAAGGCGKSFWANGVCAALRSNGVMPTVVAASGLAATVLDGGHTAHSVFGIPLTVDADSYCSVDGSRKDAIIRSPVIFWDECSMVHVHAANCVDRSLQDWMNNQSLFGGKVVIFMGDFQQLLPVVRGGSGDFCTVMAADWWRHVCIIEFTRNFRSDVSEYCEVLRSAGNGELEFVSVPECCTCDNLDDFCDAALGDGSESHRHVVCLTLQDAAYVNHCVISKMSGELVMSAAADVKVNCKDPDLYSEEFLQSLHLPRVPPAELPLRVGARLNSLGPFSAGLRGVIFSTSLLICRYMLTRNLDFQRGMVNGAEVQLLKIHEFCLRVRLASGQEAVLPRINFVIAPDESGLPFELHRRQYPIIPAYALTVHRVQGQTLRFLGLYFTGDVFCHGMLYTALSRVRSWLLVKLFRHELHNVGVPCVLRNMVRSHIVRPLRR
jgi:hypothetical protein